MGWPEGPNVIQRPILLPVMTLLLVSIAEILSVSPVWIVLKRGVLLSHAIHTCHCVSAPVTFA